VWVPYIRATVLDQLLYYGMHHSPDYLRQRDADRVPGTSRRVGSDHHPPRHCGHLVRHVFQRGEYVSCIFWSLMQLLVHVAVYSNLTSIHTHSLVCECGHTNSISLCQCQFATILKHGLDYWGYYGGIHGAASFDKVCLSFIIVSYWVVCGYKISMSYSEEGVNNFSPTDDNSSFNRQDYPGLKISLSLCVMASWSYV
jgi:hypothetical protein